MSCRQVRELLDAYIDQELDVVTALDFESHLSECDACRASYEQYRQAHDFVKTKLSYFRAPAGLEDKVRGQIRSVGREPQRAVRRKRFPGWRSWAVVAAAAVLIIMTSALVQIAKRSSSEMLAGQIVSSHIRSLMANHLVDVPSSDQHTVKPWFNGKLDFAPAVTDLSSQGFPLVGGRLDYVDNRPVAALVYRRRQHMINLFVWPSSDPDSGPHVTAIKGYNLVHWTRSQMTYWAASDLNAGELQQFVRDLQPSRKS